LSVHGIGKDRSLDDWRALVRSLLHQGLVAESQDGYPVLSLNEASWQVLKDQRKVHAATPAPRRPARRQAAAAADLPAQGTALFERLRALRKRLADEHGMPPYVIFHDATLREMALRRPITLAELGGIRGVGEFKLSRYGEPFVAAVREHESVIAP
jgi:ATP-dependent DNA helicase RecQ